MGWDYEHAQYYDKRGNVDRKRILDERYTWEDNNAINAVIKSSMKGSTYYAAVKRIEKSTGKIKIWGLVCLTHIDMKEYFNFGCKPISEDMAPYERECPKSILDLLTPTDSKLANEWRDDCRRNLKRIKPGDLPVGTKIRFSTYNGKTYEIVKCSPAYQFKRNWWYHAETNTAFRSTKIPQEFEIMA